MTRRFASTVLALTLVATLPSVGQAGELPPGDPKAEGFRPEPLEKIRGVLDGAVAARKVAGATTLIVRRGKVVHSAVSGRRDVEAGKPLERSTLFRIASMSKPITSAAVMVLVDDGKLGLDDPVSRFLPEFRDPRVLVMPRVGTPAPAEVPTVAAERPITIRQLLTHTCGLSYRFANPPVLGPLYVERAVSDGLAETPGTLADNLKRLASLPLLHQPGSAWHYGLSTDVLGRVVEVASGMSFERFLRERIFRPLKMDDTGFLVPPGRRDRLAVLYTPAEDNTILRAPEGPIQMGPLVFSGHVPTWDTGTYHSGGAGLTSTIDDYARFLQMILDKGELEGARVLKVESVEAMTRHQIGDLRIPPIGQGEGFGLGFGVVLDENRDRDPAGPGALSWSGLFYTYFWVDVRREMIALIMAQVAPARDLSIGPDFKRLTYEALIE